MKIYQPAARSDTMLGVCQSLGEDFGIPPNLLRMAFGVGLIVVPVQVIVAYVAMAFVVAVTIGSSPARGRWKRTAKPKRRPSLKSRSRSRSGDTPRRLDPGARSSGSALPCSRQTAVSTSWLFSRSTS